MKRMVESITGGYTSSARVVDNALVISLPDALSPIVWRMDLGQVRSSALEVRERDGNHILTLKTARADVHDIAPFASKGDAVRALMAVSRALETGDRGGSRPSPSLLASDVPPPAPVSVRRSGGILKWVAVAAAIFIIFLLFAAAHRAAPVPGQFAAAGGAPSATSFSGTPVNTPGEPVSADSFLMQNGGKPPQTQVATPTP